MAVTHVAPGDDDLRDRLDELIPPSGPSGRRLLLSALVVGSAVGITVASIGGWLYPRPTTGGTFSSNSLLFADRERGVVATEIFLPNYSQRAVRVTAITVDAPGARIVETAILLDEEQPAVDDRTRETVEAAEPFEVSTIHDGAEPVPVWIPAGRHARIVVWFEPLDCDDRPAPWGIAEVTVDFGDGAFPPIGRTIRLDQDPIRDDDGPYDVLVADELVTAAGPLAAACEALR